MDPSTPPAPPVALCLGGWDPSGGAGLLRDAATLSALGVHPMAVCTAETLQNGVTCERIQVPALDPLLQMERLRGHLTGIWGLKLGLWALPHPALEALSALLREWAPPVLIWDPIAGPSSGPTLHGTKGILAMADLLLPSGAWVVAPNRQEAADAVEASPDDDPRSLAEAFLARGARAVWLKGGHASGDRVQDHWVTAEDCVDLDASPRLPGERRGTGCALAAAWLAFRLLGEDEVPAARSASVWLRSRWNLAFAPGGLGRPLFSPMGAS